MSVFHKPRPGVLGDTIPYDHDGRYHVYYLYARRGQDSCAICSAGVFADGACVAVRDLRAAEVAAE